MKARTILAIFFITGLFFNGCNQETKQANPEVISESDKPAGDQKTEQSTSIEFQEKEYDFGNITQGEMVSHTFTFKNSGTSPLIILDAKASCGCTVPQWTKDPIAPGGSGQIEVKYNGSGSGKVHKTVTVTANTEPKETVLEIMANVKPIDMNNKGPFKN